MPRHPSPLNRTPAGIAGRYAVLRVAKAALVAAIQRDAIDEWRRFAPWLGSLQDALGDAVERWDDHQEERK